jgi:hypothetical protein
VAAYRAAAELSTTPWFFAVFAKLEVSSALIGVGNQIDYKSPNIISFTLSILLMD